MFGSLEVLLVKVPRPRSGRHLAACLNVSGYIRLKQREHFSDYQRL
jgi:hypothetical protein